jgi:hypothetical protein
MRLWLAGEGALFTLGRWRTGCLNHRLQQLPEIFQSSSGDNNRVAPAADILRYAQKAAAGILFQGKNEKLAFNLNSIGFNGVLGGGRLGV